MVDSYRDTGGTKDRVVGLIRDKWDDQHESFGQFLENTGLVRDTSTMSSDQQIINKLETYRPLVPA